MKNYLILVTMLMSVPVFASGPSFYCRERRGEHVDYRGDRGMCRFPVLGESFFCGSRVVHTVDYVLTHLDAYGAPSEMGAYATKRECKDAAKQLNADN
jgi:hypothetical protein